MKLGKRILLLVACVALLLISWFTAATADSTKDKQAALISEAEKLLADEVYVRAVPLLEEAAGYDEIYRDKAESLLKDCYLQLFGTTGYSRKYTALLETQMGREDASPAVFREAAEYYIDIGKLSDALKILRDGIAKTGDAGLTEYYEANRYGYKLGRAVYEEAAEIYGGSVQVMRNGKWGMASGDGSLVVPCIYDHVSTWSGGQMVVLQDGVISAVDSNGNRVALLREECYEFGNLATNRIALKLSDGWHLATGSFAIAGTAFEDMGTMANAAIPAKQNGKWGLLDGSGSEWIVPNEYDAIITDSLGRAYFRNAVFVRSGDEVKLIVDGEFVGETYEEAKPFVDSMAAVKKNGKWGFIDIRGNIRIECQFDDALSFSGHLAAVKQGDNWGYITFSGDMVIEPVFLEAKNFFEGSAPVKTEDGWQFITLLEYM